MPLFGLLAVGALALFFLASKKTPGGISPQAAGQLTVPIVLADDRTIDPSATARWHATNEQNQLFGPHGPTYWSRNGYFLFDNGKGSFDHYKPDWQVPIVSV